LCVVRRQHRRMAGRLSHRAVRVTARGAAHHGLELAPRAWGGGNRPHLRAFGMPAMPSPLPPPVARPHAPQPRLWRSATNRVVLGVIGGISEKLGWEAKPLRILAGLLGILTLPIGALPALVPSIKIWAIPR